MNLERWQRLKELFGAALERVPSERGAYLREACGPDEELRAEVEALLAEYDSEKSVAEETASSSFDDAQIAERKIGPYQLIRRIGTGGMGAVYLAVRADDTYSKQVAIKVVHASIETREILERFRHERQILATLDHPNIAKLLDGGATGEGLPYFAMDYVEGERIDQYCARHKLPAGERVRLFREVCSAVQYVHQSLVLHRDLKPGNILVTAEGVPKLLDFGIAKLLKPDPLRELTRAEFRPMTPGYASPEQVRGESITTASDVYSLGVILYELLTSHSPYSLRTDAPTELLRAVCEEEPEKPSTAAMNAGKAMTPEAIAAERGTSPVKLRRQLSGDLDNIVLKALRKEPRRRYVSVEQLSEDLRRYLTGLPVSARRDTWSYRAGKFAGRHKAGVAAAALVVASLAGGGLTAAWQARVAMRERATAQRRFNDVRKLATSFLFEFHGAIQHLPGSTPARKLLVQRALEYLSQLSREAQGDASLERELAEAYLKLGDVQGNIYGAHTGDTRGAVESYRSALRISQALTQANGNDVPARLYLARSYESLGQLMPILGKPSEGLADLRKASELLEGLSAADPGNESLRAELANSYQARGDLEGHSGLQNLGDPAAALVSYRKGLDIYKDLATRKPDSQSARRGLAVLRIRIADLGLARGDSKRGLNEYREALAALENLAAADPANTELGHLAAVGYRKVGGALEESGQLKEALGHYAKAAALNESLTKADPGNAQAAMGLAITLRYTGDLLARNGDQAGALAHYHRVLAILEKLSESQPDNVLVGGRRAEMLIFAAAALTRNGKLDKARQATSRALAITRKLASRADATADEFFEYAASFLNCTPPDLREPATAVEYAGRSVEKSGGRDRDALELLARAYFQNGDPARAVETEEKALSLLPAGDVARRKMEAQLARFKAARKHR